VPTRARQPKPADPDLPEVVELTSRQRRQLAGPPLASPWDPYDRLFGDWDSGHVFDYGSVDSRALDAMLDQDGTAKQLEQVLCLPLRGADWEIEGTGRFADMIRDQLPHDMLDMTMAQMTSAIVHRKAFFESTWALDGADVRLSTLEFRPASSCEAGWHPKTGREVGFRQRVGNPGGLWPEPYSDTQSAHPGYVYVPQQRSFIYTHGTHRQPKKGLSDLAVAWWAYETRRKVLFLWLQFLETQSLPRVLFYGDDEKMARSNANAFAQLKGGGTLGMRRGADPSAKMVDVVESNGDGAGQFIEAIRYLEQQMVDSVLAGFTKLSSAAASGAGSYALSVDQSEFFTMQRQAVADEMAAQIKRAVFGPVVVYNGGAAADVPNLKIGPLSTKNTERALDLLKTIIVAPEVRVPDEFTDMLTLGTASMLGLDVDELQAAIEEHAKVREQDNTLKREQAKVLFEQQKSGLLGPPGAQAGRAPGAGAAGGRKLATAAAVNTSVVRRAQAGQDPKDAVRAVRNRAGQRAQAQQRRPAVRR
jgi:hypothetical protein